MHFNNPLNYVLCQGLNKNGQASTASPQVTCSYSAQDLLSKCAPGTKCTKEQLYFRVNSNLSTCSSVQLFVKCLQLRSLNRVNMYDVVCACHLCCILKSVFAFVFFPVLLLGTLDLMVWNL